MAPLDSDLDHKLKVERDLGRIDGAIKALEERADKMEAFAEKVGKELTTIMALLNKWLGVIAAASVIGGIAAGLLFAIISGHWKWG